MDTAPILLATGGTLGWADWLTLAGYFFLLAASGFWVSRRTQNDASDYFLAGRSMPAWAVALSVLATSQSAATFIGAPQSAYRGDLTYLSANIGQIIAAIVVALFFIPALYRCRAATVYELLEVRVGWTARAAASLTFMVGRVMASGARLFMGSLAGAMILFGDIEPAQVVVAIGVVTSIGIVYTLVGGVRSVIVTDVIQAVVYVGAAGAALAVLLLKIPVGLGQVLEALQSGMPDGASKLRVVDTAFGGLDRTYTLWTALGGFALLNLGFYGTDQDAMQRMLTCRTAARGAWSMIGAVLAGIPVTLLFMFVGLLLWVFYTQPQLMGTVPPGLKSGGSAKIFLQFILREMPPGLGGLMLAGLMAAGLSSLNSALHALSSCLVGDFVVRCFSGVSSRRQVVLGRLGVVLAGILVGLFAAVCAIWHHASDMALIDFALLVMTFAYAGLVAVFLTVLFTRRGSSVSILAALAGGFLLVILMQPPIWEVDCRLLAMAAERVSAHRVADWFEDCADWKPAFPWQLVIATGIASVMCCAGRRPHEQTPDK